MSIRPIGTLSYTASINQNCIENVLRRWIRQTPLGEDRYFAANCIHLFLRSDYTTLSLQGLNLSELPRELFAEPAFQERLQELYLCNNRFTRIPSEIHQLKNLQHLSLSNNQIEEVSSALRLLDKLQVLDLSKNRIPIKPQLPFPCQVTF